MIFFKRTRIPTLVSLSGNINLFVRWRYTTLYNAKVFIAAIFYMPSYFVIDNFLYLRCIRTINRNKKCGFQKCAPKNNSDNVVWLLRWVQINWITVVTPACVNQVRTAASVAFLMPRILFETFQNKPVITKLLARNSKCVTVHSDKFIDLSNFRMFLRRMSW